MFLTINQISITFRQYYLEAKNFITANSKLAQLVKCSLNKTLLLWGALTMSQYSYFIWKWKSQCKNIQWVHTKHGESEYCQGASEWNLCKIITSAHTHRHIAVRATSYLPLPVAGTQRQCCEFQFLCSQVNQFSGLL